MKGPAIDAWFKQRGAKRPGSLNPEDSECLTVKAPVPSGQALSCEQHSAIRPWVRTSRRMLFDVRDGKTLVLVNLISKVAPFDAAGGGACQGALAVLRVQVSEDGNSLTVSDEAGCGCDQAEKSLKSSSSADSQALEMQAREVKQACSQRGAYVWEAHGFVPAH